MLARHHRSQHPLQLLDDESEQRIASREADPAIVLDTVHPQRRVRSTIEELRSTVSQTNHRILYDHWIRGKSFAEIAEPLGLTAKQARDRHARVVGKLRKLFTDASAGNPDDFTPSWSVGR